MSWQCCHLLLGVVLSIVAVGSFDGGAVMLPSFCLEMLACALPGCISAKLGRNLKDDSGVLRPEKKPVEAGLEVAAFVVLAEGFGDTRAAMFVWLPCGGDSSRSINDDRVLISAIEALLDCC